MGVSIPPGRLKTALERRQWSSQDLAAAAGISVAVVRSAAQGRPVAPRTLKAIVVTLCLKRELDERRPEVAKALS